MILAEVANHAHQVHPHHITAEREEQSLPEAQKPHVAPQQINADGENRVTEIFAIKINSEIADVQRATRRSKRVKAREQHKQNYGGHNHRPCFEFPTS